jgi:hypothetical protein
VKGFSSFDFIFSALLVGSTVVMTFDFVEMKRSGLVVVQGVLADEGLATRFTGPFPRLFDLGVAPLGGGSLHFVPAFVFPSFDSGIISLTSSDYCSLRRISISASLAAIWSAVRPSSSPLTISEIAT